MRYVPSFFFCESVLEEMSDKDCLGKLRKCTSYYVDRTFQSLTKLCCILQ